MLCITLRICIRKLRRHGYAVMGNETLVDAYAKRTPCPTLRLPSLACIEVQRQCVRSMLTVADEAAVAAAVRLWHFIQNIVDCVLVQRTSLPVDVVSGPGRCIWGLAEQGVIGFAY